MSTTSGSLTFEATREAVTALPSAKSEGERTLVWVDEGRALALARDTRGRLEVFIVCDAIEAIDALVRENLQHQVWTTASGEPLSANRLVLPSAPHFDSVAAFICAELLQNGVNDDVPEAFRRSEPVIALAIRRAALSNQALVGLVGELLVIARLVDALPHRSTEIVNGWYGSSPSTRDLQLGSIGIEIKTTTGTGSQHHIQGFHQIEPGVSVDAIPETHLFLLSIGIQWLPPGEQSGWSLPQLVETVAGSLTDPELREAFLNRVKQYGGDAAVGYDHERHRSSARYNRRFESRFERLYDLQDDRILLLRRDDVAEATHVDADSVSFRIDLPPKVRGDVNPVHGIAAILVRIGSLMAPQGGPLAF